MWIAGVQSFLESALILSQSIVGCSSPFPSPFFNNSEGFRLHCSCDGHILSPLRLHIGIAVTNDQTDFVPVIHRSIMNNSTFGSQTSYLLDL